ncbi:uncharacterized protein BDR25DRAFT_270741 [Lindgomyces ingoldianus]|uniref:Uncharacterized protein n=1 Tax=Lindgomyces ingoldianus TaxID=673940 RepID=A0ACB6QE81_9PLEO|nr:uncharacterized protein BDR25DRAFT_270741 [Lindgomyces ingoldianus]KAF2465219.1 hypothetical protein BDR25DRAFT_270741 [Lindgomyces ingoldianus]
MTSGCASLRATIEDPLFNASDMLRERWEDSPKDDRRRLELCWGYQDCGDCHRSNGSCGWCAISSTCLPLPLDPLSLAFPLLSPLRYKFICALGPERFELRTSGLGCQVSTITFLTSIVTIFCTIAGFIILYGLIKVIEWVRNAWKAGKGGWIVYADGSGEVWFRRKESWGRWWRRTRRRSREEEELVVGEGTGERLRWFWWVWRKERRAAEPEAEERTALLG